MLAVHGMKRRSDVARKQSDKSLNLLLRVANKFGVDISMSNSNSSSARIGRHASTIAINRNV